MSLESIIEHLNDHVGRDFERAVVAAFNFMGFDAEQIERTQAESDIIVKARFSINPYVGVIECEAVREGSQVSYTKLGQLRGSFESYVDQYEGYSSHYKMIVGKPIFSDDSINRSKPDVVLLSKNMMIKLLEYYNRFLFSQDEMETLFRNYGEIIDEDIEYLCGTYKRKLALYSLIYLCLIKVPNKNNLNNRKNFILITELMGAIKMLANFTQIIIDNDGEISEAIRDLYNPFLQIVEIEGNKIKLFSRSYESMVQNLNRYGSDFHESIEEMLSRI